MTHSTKEFAAVLALIVGALACLLWATRRTYPKRLGYRPELKIRGRFGIACGVCFGVYVICDQNHRTHATTIYRIGIGVLCFNPEITISWMNR